MYCPHFAFQVILKAPNKQTKQVIFLQVTLQAKLSLKFFSLARKSRIHLKLENILVISLSYNTNTYIHRITSKLDNDGDGGRDLS